MFFVGIFLAVCLDANVENLQNNNYVVSMLFVILGLCVFFLLSYCYRRYGAKKFYLIRHVWNFAMKYNKALCIFYFLLLYIVQCVIAFHIFQKVGWDANATWDAATWWQTHEDPMLGEYLLVYPNNIGLTLLLYLIRIPVQHLDLTSQYWVVVMWNIVSVDLGIFVCFRLAKKLLGKKVP